MRGLHLTAVMYCRTAASAGEVFGRRFLLFADDALPAARAVGHVRVVRVLARTEDVAGRFRRRLALEALDEHGRQLLARDVVGTVVVRRRQVVVAVGPGPVHERRADKDDGAAVEAIRIRCGCRRDGYRPREARRGVAARTPGAHGRAAEAGAGPRAASGASAATAGARGPALVGPDERSRRSERDSDPPCFHLSFDRPTSHQDPNIRPPPPQNPKIPPP